MTALEQRVRMTAFGRGQGGVDNHLLAEYLPFRWTRVRIDYSNWKATSSGRIWPVGLRRQRLLRRIQVRRKRIWLTGRFRET